MNGKLVLVLVAALACALYATMQSEGALASYSKPPHPPANDDFAKATLIRLSNDLYTDAVDVTGATAERSEPCGVYCISKTVWYKYAPGADTVVNADVTGSNFVEAALIVYSGSEIANLTIIGSSGRRSSVQWTASAGKTYYLQAGGNYDDFASRQLVLNVRRIPALANDNLADAQRISSPLPFTNSGNYFDMTGATREVGEPLASCGWGNQPGTIWYAYTPTTGDSLLFYTNASGYGLTAVYTGSSVDQLQEIACGNSGQDPGPALFRPTAGTTYYFQVSDLYSWSGGSVQFQLELAPPPTAGFDFNPNDASIFDTLQFNDRSSDPAGGMVNSWSWDFGDETPNASGGQVTHRYAVDGSYSVVETVTTADERSVSTSQLVTVKTHDVGIARLTAPGSGEANKTGRIAVEISNKRYPEQVEVQLWKSTTGGFVQVGSLVQAVPVSTSGRKALFAFSYTFTADDAAMGEVTFKAIANLIGARDALPGDNEAVALPTKVRR